MKRFVKRSMAAILVVVMLLSAAPLNGFVGLFDMFDFSVEASAASSNVVDDSTVKSILESIKKEYPNGSYFSVNGKACQHGSRYITYSNGATCTNCQLKYILKAKGISASKYANGWTCYAFASYCFTQCFGKTWTSSNYTVVANANLKNKTNKEKEAFFKAAKPGDILEIPGHYMVFIKSDSTGVTVYDANVGGKYYCAQGHSRCPNHTVSPKYGGNTGTVRYAKIKYSNFSFSSVKVQHAKNYADVNCTITLNKTKDTVTNTSATINANLNASFSLQGAYYILSTNKADVNVDATKENNRKKTSTRDFVTVKGAHTAKSVKADVLTYQGAKLQPKKTYYYKILVKVSGKWYQSSVSYFTTANNLPATPELTFVTGKTDYSVSDAVAVSWKSAANADSYNVTVYDASSNAIFTKPGITSNTFSFEPNAKELPAAGDYYFSVTAVNAVGKKESAKKKFTLHEDKTVEFFDPLTNKVLKTETVPYGGTATAPKMSSVKGYTFIKWDGNFTTVKENTRVAAVFEPHEYTVTFVDDKNSVISKETVKYGQSATVPKDPEKTGYDFVAWVVKNGDGDSYTSVNGNVTFEPTFAWTNPDLPLAVKLTKALRTSDSKGYTVYSEITNGKSEAINAKLIAVIKTSNGKTVATKMDIITVPANASNYAVTTNVGGTAVGTVAEVYIVANDKDDDNKTGGAYSKVATVKVTRESTTNNKYWGEWSSWSISQPTESSTREIESKIQYRYADKSTTTSTSSSLSGWEKDGYTYGSWGNWGAWTTSAITETETVDVETKTLYRYYYYACASCKNRQPYWNCACTKCGKHVDNSVKAYYWTTTAYKDSKSTKYNSEKRKTTSVKGSEVWYFSAGNLNHTAVGTNDAAGTATVIKKGYRKRTRTKTYNYYKYSAWSAWSDTVYTETSTRKVEAQTVYRYRDLYTSTETVSETYIGEENLSGKSYTINGSLENVATDYSGKVATVMVYKEKNTDPTESQIEYVGQVTLGAGNSYNFTFIPREEISMATGDYIVSFGIATADGLVNYAEIIEAPKPEHKVTFYDFDGTTVLETITVKEGETAVPSASTVEALSVPEGHRFTNWNQSTVNVRADLSVLPQSEVQKFAVVFIDWESQKFVLEELEYGEEIIVPEATQKEGYIVSWDMSMAKEMAPEATVAEGDEEINSDVNIARYTVVRHTVIPTTYEEIEYNSIFVSPESDLALKENGIIEDEFEVETEGDKSEIQFSEEDVVSNETNTFDEYIETPMDIEEAEEYIFRGWKNVLTGEYLTDMRPESDAIYVPMYEFAETVEDPVADIVTGEYTEAQTVTLTSETESAVIYYTLDGTDPQTSETAIMYTGPITISSSVVLKACAMAVNMNNSSTVMELYAINTGSVTPYHIVSVYTDLPYMEGVAYQSLVKDFVRFDATPLQDFEGYTFSGLYYDEDLTEEFDTQNEPVIESMDVFAHYVAKQYTVTFLDEDGTTLSTQSVEYGTAAEAPQAPAKEGYVFIGWDSDGYECVTEDGTYTARYIPESEYAYVSIKGKAVIPAYVGTEVKLSIEITPDELSDEPVSWTSSDPSIATVDYQGNVTLVGIGTVYITVTVDSNGESDTVTFRVNEDNTVKVVLGPQSYMMYDTTGYLRGLKVAVNTVEEVRSHFTNDELHFFNPEGTELSDTDKVGTDTVVCLMDGDDILDEKTFIMTGDVNGDGWYDGQDSTIVACIAEGMLTADDVSEAVYIAADCNYDGVIDQKDVELLNKAGALISNVDQNQPAEELEEDEDFVAYASLIDQTADFEIEIEDTDEIPAEPDEEVNTDPENGENTEDDSTQPEDDTNNSFEWSFLSILEFFKSVFSFLMSLIFG